MEPFDERDALACVNPFMPTGAFNIYSPRDCVSRHNGGTLGAPLKPLRVDSALRLYHAYLTDNETCSSIRIFIVEDNAIQICIKLKNYMYEEVRILFQWYAPTHIYVLRKNSFTLKWVVILLTELYTITVGIELICFVNSWSKKKCLLTVEIRKVVNKTNDGF